MDTFRWRKGVFSSTYEIFSQKGIAGQIRSRNWSRLTDAVINGKRYLFRTQGFFTVNTLIIDPENNALLGKISYNSWRSIASIEFKGLTTILKSESIWRNLWSVWNANEPVMRFKGSSSSGTIEVGKSDELLMISSFFAITYFWKAATIAVVTSLMPIWITILTK